MKGRLARRALLGSALPLALAGCAAPRPPVAAPGERSGSGRIALTVEGRPNQSLSAGFALRGAPANGELTLTNPLGGVLAVLAWAPGEATLRSGNETRRFESLEALAAE